MRLDKVGTRLCLVLLCAFPAYGSITINDIDKLVNDIKKERVGLTDKEIKEAKDPFVYFTKSKRPIITPSGVKSTTRKYRFNLRAIVNNRVKINGRWYGLHDKIYGYTIDRIGTNFVVLSKNNTHLRVFMQTKKLKKIKINAR